MLNPKLLRQDIDLVAEKLLKRSFRLPKNQLMELEAQRKQIEIATQELQNERNTKSKAIGVAKAQGQDIQPLLDDVKDLGDKVDASEKINKFLTSHIKIPCRPIIIFQLSQNAFKTNTIGS